MLRLILSCYGNCCSNIAFWTLGHRKNTPQTKLPDSPSEKALESPSIVSESRKTSGKEETVVDERIPDKTTAIIKDSFPEPKRRKIRRNKKLASSLTSISSATPKSLVEAIGEVPSSLPTDKEVYATKLMPERLSATFFVIPSSSSESGATRKNFVPVAKRRKSSLNPVGFFLYFYFI